MGNLRDKYTDEEWDQISYNPTSFNMGRKELKNFPRKKDYIITEHLGSAFGKVKVHRLIQVTKDYRDGFVKGIKTKSKGEVFCEEIV